MTLAEQNETVIRRLYQEASIKMLPCGCEVDFNLYAGKKQCLDCFAQFFNSIGSSFSNCAITIKSIVIRDDRAMVHYTVCGTQKKEFMGIPATGEEMVITGIDVFRLSSGKVVEYWDAAHQLTTLERVH